VRLSTSYSYDKTTGKMITKEKTLAMVRTEPRISAMSRNKDNKKDLQKLAEDTSIDIKYEEEEVIENWYGKPKGMLQVMRAATMTIERHRQRGGRIMMAPSKNARKKRLQILS
jgi:hypothetical protein